MPPGVAPYYLDQTTGIWYPAAMLSHGIPIVSAQIGDGPNIDAFGRLRISQPVGVFDVQCQYEASPFLLETGATGTGSAGVHSANTRMVGLSASAGAGTSFIQSYEYVPYQPGKSKEVLLTFVLGSGSAGCTKDVGCFDADNGIFLRQNGTAGLQFVRRTKTSGSVVNNTVNQAAWNYDTLDGSGNAGNPSGILLDPTKAQILVIVGQFLGMGRVQCGFNIGGQFIPCHQFLNANNLDVPYMQTLTLPVQMLLTTTSAAGLCWFKCASVISEGGSESPSAYDFATAEQTVTAGSGAKTHILSLRPATTFNTFTNRCRLKIETVEVLVTGNNPVLWELCIGSTFSAGPTFGAVNAGSSAEQSTAVGTLTAAGTVIAAGYCPASATNKTAIGQAIAAKYPISLDRAGAVRANGTLSLLVTGIGAGSATRAVINYSEVR